MDTDKNTVGRIRLLRESADPGRLFPICVYLCSSVASSSKSLSSANGARLHLSFSLLHFGSARIRIAQPVAPQFGAAPSLWLDIGAQRRRYNNCIQALPRRPNTGIGRTDL
jgi:hypothetical protein